MKKLQEAISQSPNFAKRDWLKFFLVEILSLATMVFLILYTDSLNSVYATTSDILLQHIPLADNLRQLFYQTHQLIPQFIPNLGGGQNAFYLTYHGLANPLIILTYFLPFLNMYHCWLLIMTLVILATVGLSYWWFRLRFSSNYSLIGALLTLLTTPLLLHTHYHYMFIDYIPWLLLALIGVDKALYKHKYILLIISLTLISLTSYYYLPTCILAIGIYSTFVYFEKNDLKINIKQLGKDISRILISLLLGILLAAFSLLPTAFTIIQSSAGRQYNINLIELLIPNFNITSNGYSINISILALIIITTLIFSKSKKYFITTTLFLISVLFPIFEIFASTSSTGLPIKALIPLLPIFCLLAISSLRFIESFLLNRFSLNKNFKKPIWIKLTVFGLSALLIISNTITTVERNMPNKNYYKYTSENTIQYNKEFTDTVQNTLNSNQPIYRSNMTNYSTGLNIYNNVFSPNQFSDSIYTSINSQNWQNYHWQKLWTASKGVYPWVMPAADSPLADILQGVKYHFTTSSEDKNAITGYKYIAPHIYQNNSVFSIGYASNNIFSNINNMTDIEQTACLTQGIATQGVAVQKIDTKENIKESQTLPKTDHFETVDLANLAEQITQHNNSSRDNTKDNSENKKNISFEYNLPKQIENKPLFIKVNLQQNSQSSKIDSYLTINNVKNTIAYAKQQWLGYSDLHYVLSPDKNGAINKLTINLLPDHWNIKNIEAFTMPTNDLLNAYKYFDQMNVDSITTAGISGNINISHNNSVLAISTAWEPGFSLKIDGIQTPIFEANGGIIGSFINKGQHRIELEFHAPYYNAGLVISLATLVLLILLYLIKSLNKGFGRNKKYYNKKASKN